MSTLDQPDTTLPWVKRFSNADGVVRPGLVMRMTTDSNYIYNRMGTLAGYGPQTQTKAMLNCGMPGMRIPGILQWTVNESIESPTHTATAEFVNALPESQLTTTLTADLAQEVHSTTVISHVVKDSGGVPQVLSGSFNVAHYTDPSSGGKYMEDNVMYRIMANHTVSVASTTGFPDPRIPTDESDSQTFWPTSATGSGSYFIKINDEVMRVHDYTGSTFLVPPGGRGVNGVIQAHTTGDTVTLLGFAPYTGSWAGIGYLSAHDYRPYRSPLRPGTCFASYEGYGTFPTGSLSKTSWHNHYESYDFTGYWFVTSQESTLSSDGRATITVNLSSSGHILQQQKINPTSLRRLKVTDDAWAAAIWDEAGHNRNIPGDWVDFKSWNPRNPNAYPLKLKIEMAQHKEFLEHMESSNQGTNCPQCYQEWTDALGKTNKGSQNEIALQRQVGKHIYEESVRVYNQTNGVWDAGPIHTYGRLMMAMAKACWENQTFVDANPLAQRWTKIPNELWDNLSNWHTGRVWNGSLAFTFTGDKTTNHFDNGKWEGYSYDNSTTQDRQVLQMKREKFLCPFEASYDKQEWYAPIADLAELNRMTFQISRRGHPILAPLGMKLRGRSYIDEQTGITGEWHLAWGQSITSYSHNLDADQVYSHVVVSGKTAFESDFSITAAGTSLDLLNNVLYWHSPVVGNKEALQLTGGIPQIETVQLDQIVFGLDWDTNMNTWGSVVLVRDGIYTSFAPMSYLPTTFQTLKYDPGAGASSRGKDVELVQSAVNSFIKRRYISIPQDDANPPNEYPFGIDVDGVYGSATEDAVERLQNMLRNTTQPGGGFYITSSQYAPGGVFYGKWTSHMSERVNKWISDNAEYIKKDIWWYALAGLPWEYYLSAVTGLPIPQKKAEESTSVIEDGWVIDQNQLFSNIEEWQKAYYKAAVMIGNVVVDNSLNKAAVRQVTTNYADPRILVGDVIWLDIPGFLSANDIFEEARPPYEHGVYVTQISRTMDLQAGTYTATYSGYRYRGQTDSTFATNPDNYYQDYN